MAQRSHVPKFGDWESEQNVPYTVYFDKARKGRTGTKMVNPNDPRENPVMISDYPSNARAPPPKSKPEPNEPLGRGVGRTREEGWAKGASEFRACNRSGPRVSSADTPRKQSEQRSPFHPRVRAYGRVSGTSTRVDESPDKGAAVPKFGEWDENNPASADGYTHIFNKVREERQSNGGKVPDMATDPSYNQVRMPAASSGSKICCFPWGGK